MLRRWCIALSGITLVAGSLGAVAPGVASAATWASRVSVGGPLSRVGGPLSQLSRPMIYRGTRDGVVTSTAWSGYVVSGSTYSSVSATWVQPTATCTSGTALAGFWVGLDGYKDTSVEQTGSAVQCQGKKASYWAWYELYPNPPTNYSNPVKPGDDMSASVTTNGDGDYTMTITDSTQDWTQTTTLSSEGENASAEAIIEAPCCNAKGNPLALADFGKAYFDNVTVDGAKIGTLSPIKIDMADSDGHFKDRVTNLVHQENFSATWLRKD
jgi:hypothetical protein